MVWSTGWLAASVAGMKTTEMLIIGLSVAVVVVAFLLWKTSQQKTRTEQAAARVVSMSQDVLNLSTMPISRNEIGGYKLQEKLFEAVGFVTYRAEDKDGHLCDVKIPTTSSLEDKMAMARLEREAHVLEGIDNPHVVHFRAFEKAKERGKSVPILVTEPVEGEDLAEIIKRESPMPAAKVVPILEDLAGALAAVHRNEVVHRNVKPGSIKVNSLGRAMLYNFGVAQAEDAQALTQRGDVLGTGLYMSPEQMMGKSMDGRSDLYSLGVLAYEMLTGAPPHKSSNFGELVMKKMTEAAPQPGLVVSNLPPELNELVSRCMEKEPNKRPNSAGAFLTELHHTAKTMYTSKVEENE